MIPLLNDQMRAAVVLHDGFAVRELSDGMVAVMTHGYGIDKDSKFTANEIFDIGVASRKYTLPSVLNVDPESIDFREPRPLSPDAYADYNRFYWVPWSRLSHSVGSHVTKRRKMVTPNSLRFTDTSNYVGTNKDVTRAWDSYIPLEDRLYVLKRLFRGMEVDRYRYLDIGCGIGHQLVGLAAHGFDVYGLEADPAAYRNRHYLLREPNQQRVILGDALQDMYVFASGTMNVCCISCLGNIWWSDLPEFLEQVHRIMARGGVVIADIKEYPGREFRARKMYSEVMGRAGINIKLRTETMLIGVASGKKTLGE